ncbi:hypothetical protein EVAR_40890_1 [Eumeta japonica]|uniref:Uncharacterized protein n=1 Tax=Eumeta variegata TaxID=151549 RepID=A0A4C1X4E5_EUMVA|nr:hypothetical protein EVAR_40890_1 [Eumeta japonica]
MNCGLSPVLLEGLVSDVICVQFELSSLIVMNAATRKADRETKIGFLQLFNRVYIISEWVNRQCACGPRDQLKYSGQRKDVVQRLIVIRGSTSPFLGSRVTGPRVRRAGTLTAVDHEAERRRAGRRYGRRSPATDCRCLWLNTVIFTRPGMEWNLDVGALAQVGIAIRTESHRRA